MDLDLEQLRRSTPPGTGLLVATIGPPGAGKSTWRRHAGGLPGITVVNLDAIRGSISCCSGTQHALVHGIARSIGLLRASRALAGGGTVLWDSCNSTQAERRLLLEVAHDAGARAAAAVALPPLEVVEQRNAVRSAAPCPQCGRTRRVPGRFVRALHGEIAAALSLLAGEGWQAIATIAAGTVDTPIAQPITPGL